MSTQRPAAKVVAAIDYLPADVAKALIDTAAPAPVVEAVAMAAQRTAWRRASDRTTDRTRRITISARVPRSLGDHYKALALATDRSLYQFVVEALAAEAERTERQITDRTGAGGQMELWPAPDRRLD